MRSAFCRLALLPLLALPLAARAVPIDDFAVSGPGGYSAVIQIPSSFTGPDGSFYNGLYLTSLAGTVNGMPSSFNLTFLFPGACAVCGTITGAAPDILFLPDLFAATYPSQGTETLTLVPGTYATVARSFPPGPNPGAPYTITITSEASNVTPEPPTLLLLGTAMVGSAALLARRARRTGATRAD